MTTTVTYTIKQSGGDFTSLTTWEAKTQGNFTTAQKWGANTFSGTFQVGESLTFTGSGATGTFLFTDNSTYIIYHISTGTPATADQITGSTSGAKCTLTGTVIDTGVIIVGNCFTFASGYTDNVNLSGSTTSSTQYRSITVDPASRAKGIPKSAFYMKAGTSDTVGIRFTDNNTSCSDFDVDAVTNSRIGYYLPGNSNTLTNCIGAAAGAGNQVFLDSFGLPPGNTYYNCLGYAGAGNCFSFNYASFRHCVAANCSGTGFIGTQGTSTRYSFYNCVAYLNTTADYNTASGVNLGTDFNATSAAGAPPGTHTVSNVASGAFSNAAGNNFHLSGTGSVLYHAGTTTGGPSTDVDGDNYDATTPSIGFDEVISAGGTSLGIFWRSQLEGIGGGGYFMGNRIQ